MLKKVLHSGQDKCWSESKPFSLSDPVLGLNILWLLIIWKREKNFIKNNVYGNGVSLNIKCCTPDKHGWVQFMHCENCSWRCTCLNVAFFYVLDICLHYWNGIFGHAMIDFSKPSMIWQVSFFSVALQTSGFIYLFVDCDRHLMATYWTQTKIKTQHITS